MSISCHRSECNNILTNSQSKSGKFCSLRCAGLVTSKQSGLDRKAHNIEQYQANPKTCQSLLCGKQMSYDKRHNKFCDSACSASTNNAKRTRSLTTKERIRDTLKGRPNTKTRKRNKVFPDQIIGPYSKVYLRTCKATAVKFYSTNPKAYFSTDAIKASVVRYRQHCYFRFNVEDYREQMDLNLADSFGWYDQYTNQNGAAKDHMFSIADGFKLGIDPEIIRHPANCQILLQKANQSKGSKSSITLEELLKRINDWDGDPAEN